MSQPSGHEAPGLRRDRSGRRPGVFEVLELGQSRERRAQERRKRIAHVEGLVPVHADGPAGAAAAPLLPAAVVRVDRERADPGQGSASQRAPVAHDHAAVLHDRRGSPGRRRAPGREARRAQDDEVGTLARLDDADLGPRGRASRPRSGSPRRALPRATGPSRSTRAPSRTAATARGRRRGSRRWRAPSARPPRRARARARSGRAAGRTRPRQQRRDAARCGERAHARGRDVDQVVRRARAELGRQHSAAGRRQLVGVNAQLQAELARREQDAPALVDAEDALLAEDVAEHREARARRPRGSSRRSAAPGSARGSRGARRDLVRAQEGRHDAARDGARPRRGSPRGCGSRRRSRDRSRSSPRRSWCRRAASRRAGRRRAPRARRRGRARRRDGLARCRRPRPRSPGSSRRPAAAGSRRRGRPRTRGGCGRRRSRAPPRRRPRRARRRRPAGPRSSELRVATHPDDPAAATRRRPRRSAVPRSRMAAPVRGAGPASVASVPMRRTSEVALSIMWRAAPRAVATSSPATATSLLRPAAPPTIRTADGRHVERLAQETRQGLVRGAVDRRRLQPHHERAVPLAPERVLRGPRLHPHAQRHAARRLAPVDRHALLPRASSRRFRKRRLSSTSASSCRSRSRVRRVMTRADVGAQRRCGARAARGCRARPRARGSAPARAAGRPAGRPASRSSRPPCARSRGCPRRPSAR